MSAPKATIPAYAVGDAMPNNMEPKTNTIKPSGGNNDEIIFFGFSGPISDSLFFGADFGSIYEINSM